MMWALVTGGAKNLGAALCRALAEKGYNVVIHYMNSKIAAEKVARECQRVGVFSEIIQGDLSSEKGLNFFVKEYLGRFSKTNLLINNIGNYLISSALNTKLKDWYSLFHTNLHAPFALSQALMPSLKKSKGHIFNIGTSKLDVICADTYSTAYTITKQSLWILTKSLARELAPHGVKVNMVSPGHLDYSIDLPVNPKDLPMGRAAFSYEVVRAVMFMLEEESSYITGQNLEVAGGVRL